MWKDEILEEIRQIREEHAKSFCKLMFKIQLEYRIDIVLPRIVGCVTASMN